MREPIEYALDVSLALDRPTGIGRYQAEIARGVARRLQEDERLVLAAGTFRRNPLRRTEGPLADALEHPGVSLRTQRLPLRVAYLERAARGAVVFHGTNFRLPRRAGGTRLVVTVHDLAAVAHPEWLAAADAAERTRAVRDAASRADAVVVPSRAARDEAVARLGVARDSVHVVAHGISAPFLDPPPPEVARRRVAAELGIDAPYVLAVGTSEPRKNLVRLVEAFAGVQRRAPSPHRLVLAGAAGTDLPRVRASATRLGVADRLLALDRVEDAGLAALYAAADVFAYPSLDEGFGLPILEAMACGCAVLGSSAPAVAETAGDAALLADPDDATALAAALERLLGDPALRAHLVARGRVRTQAFAWDRSAAAHLGLWRALAEARAEAPPRTGVPATFRPRPG